MRFPLARVSAPLAAVLLAFPAGCVHRGGGAPQAAPPQPGAPVAAVSPGTGTSRGPRPSSAGPAVARDLRERTFEFVRQRLKEGFYDSRFGGVDWDSLTAAFRPSVLGAERSRDFHDALNAMLAALGASHALVLSPERLAAERAREPGWAGAEVRHLPEGWVVFRVTPGSPAAMAGLRMGDVVDSISGIASDSIAAAASRPWMSARERERAATATLNEWLAGNRGRAVAVVARDTLEHARALRLDPIAYPGPAVRIGNLPPTRAMVRVRVLEGGYGYLRFTAFVPALAAQIDDAIRGLRSTPGLVIDLRGNPGGYDRLGDHIAGLLMSAPTFLTETKLRRGVRVDSARPPPDPYVGPVAVLLDGLSASASEQFAAPLQEIGRIVVVGERSAGADLEAAVADLPTGGVLMYPIGEPRTPAGRRIEGAGVQPDVVVPLSRADLARGRDDQVAAAIGELRRRARRPRRRGSRRALARSAYRRSPAALL